MLYFLDNVEDGGETAFPIADNSTFDREVGHRHAHGVKFSPSGNVYRDGAN